MKTKKRSGFTLLEIMIVVAIIGLLAAIAIPAASTARVKSQRTACINNLKMMDGAKDVYALETNGQTPTMPDLHGDGHFIKSEPKCPADGTYTLGNLTTTVSCSEAGAPLYHFVGYDPTTVTPVTP